MKQEDRLLTQDEMIVVLKSVPVIYRDSDLEILRVHLEAQDAKSIKLRDKEWIEEIEKMSSTYGTTARAMSEEDWQSLKSKMGVEDD